MRKPFALLDPDPWSFRSGFGDPKRIQIQSPVYLVSKYPLLPANDGVLAPPRQAKSDTFRPIREEEALLAALTPINPARNNNSSSIYEELYYELG